MNLKSLRQALGMVLSVALIVSTLFVASSPAMAATQTVKMGSDTSQLAFVPNNVTASPGDTITFEMNKMAPHNVVFDDSALNDAVGSSALMFAPGESVSLTIPGDTAAGTYNFYCSPHRGAGMVGQLTVQ